MKKRDLIIITAVLAVSALLYLLFAKSGNEVKIVADGKPFGEYSLSENRTIDINGTNTLTISDGKAYMSNATCPDKLCINQGKIDKNGGSIICLPNKVIVEIKGDTDTVSR